MRYFLYVRKSTDTEDKQVLSIEAQLAELGAVAKRDGLEVAEEFIEKRSAKVPGRPVFEEMLRRLEHGDAQGILCWKIDRLSRNPVDSGRISWLLQQGTIAKIVTHDRTYLPHDNVLLMSVEFGMANQYIRDLSVNVTRGLRQKARMGVYPSSAPFGYLNDPRTKTIVVDKKKAPLVMEIFELYAEGRYRQEDIAGYLFEHGVTTGATRGWTKGGGKPLKRDQVLFILSNPFYYGYFRYAGELYEGRHAPLISKQLFDKVQKVIATRGKTRKSKNEPQALCGLLHCGTCGCSITAEVITKRQKNGNTHRYVYYRCTKKRGACSEQYVREEVLRNQLVEKLSLYALPEEWAKDMFALADKDENDSGISARVAVQELRDRIVEFDTKLARLTDLYVDQDIDRETYLERKRSLVSDKRTVQEQIARLEHNATAWLQPLRDWITEAQSLNVIATSWDMDAQKSSLQKIFGSNLTLTAREARGMALAPWDLIVGGKEKAAKGDQFSVAVTLPGIEPGLTA